MVCFRYVVVNILHKGDKKDNNNNNNNNPVRMMDRKKMFFLGYKVGNRIKNVLPSLNVINSCHFTLQSLFRSSSRTVVVMISFSL